MEITCAPPLNLDDPNKKENEQKAIDDVYRLLDGKVADGEISGYSTGSLQRGTWKNSRGNLDHDASQPVRITQQGTLEEIKAFARMLQFEIAEIYRRHGSPQELIWTELRDIDVLVDGDNEESAEDGEANDDARGAV